VKRVLTLCLALTLLLSACSAAPSGETQTVYLLTNGALAEGRVALPAGGNRQAQCDAVLAALRQPEENLGLQSPLTGVGVTVVAMNARLEVRFDDSLSHLSAGRRSLAMAATALSLLEIQGVGYLYITVDGVAAPPFDDRPVSRASFLTEADAMAYF
jgi:hypothetical protein